MKISDLHQNLCSPYLRILAHPLDWTLVSTHLCSPNSSSPSSSAWTPTPSSPTPPWHSLLALSWSHSSQNHHHHLLFGLWTTLWMSMVRIRGLVQDFATSWPAKMALLISIGFRRFHLDPIGGTSGKWSPKSHLLLFACRLLANHPLEDPVHGHSIPACIGHVCLVRQCR